MWAVYYHSYWLVMMDVLLDKVMYLPLQTPASSHKAVLSGSSVDLRPQQETAPRFMSLRTASIYQASAGSSSDLQQDAIWSYMSEIDSVFIVANIFANFRVWRGVLCFSFSSGLSSLQFIGLISLVRILIYRASSSFIFTPKGSFTIVRL